MKRILTYISMMLWMLVSCQTPQLTDVPMPEGSASGEVTVTFNVDLPDGGMTTKARGDDPISDIDSLYLVVFDENGYYVETCKATLAATSGDDERSYTVTLHKTDKMRIIHFIAFGDGSKDLMNLVHYGHETEVIANMYVENNEAAYWYRMSVWYIMTETVGTKEVLVSEIQEKFNDIPLLRNYAMIRVEENLPDFELSEFAIYNTIDKGTIAPYCSEHHEFQTFYTTDGTGKRTLLTYDDHLTKGYEFRGHTLFDAKLKTTLTEDEFISKDDPWYMYERKISVSSNEEHKWSESPAHIIIKGKYNGGRDSYYKIDMVRLVEGKNQYYNILRNFQYIFTITSIAGDGYATLEEAMDKPAGNNLSGSTDTQGFTNVSDGLGRIFVSYTDTTLISSGDIKLKYKYIPNVNNGAVDNSKVTVSGILDGTGSVLKSLKSKNDNVGDGWAEVVFEVQNVGAISHIQEITLDVAENANLHKTIRYRLQKPYDMTVECTPNYIEAVAEEPVTVLIRVPNSVNENVFPLDFRIETRDLTLSPDVSKNEMPVEPAMSIVPGREGKNSFHYVKSIETYEEYLSLPVVNGSRVIVTSWLTTKAQNASVVYVENKYFNSKSAEFFNGSGFSDLSFPDGVSAQPGTATRFTFYINMMGDVRVTLTKGLSNQLNGSDGCTFVYSPTSTGLQELTFYTTESVDEIGIVEVKLESLTSTAVALKSATPSDKIIIPQLTVTFKYRHNYSPSVNTVTPVLSIGGNGLTYDGINRSRTGGSTNYTYTIVYSNIQLSSADMDKTMEVRLDYNNGHGNTYIYKASAKVSDLMTNPYMTMRCYGSNGDTLHGCDN